MNEFETKKEDLLSKATKRLLTKNPELKTVDIYAEYELIKTKSCKLPAWDRKLIQSVVVHIELMRRYYEDKAAKEAAVCQTTG